jgi:hypothetical protein
MLNNNSAKFNFDEVFNRYENKLIERLNNAMFYGYQSVMREYALKIIEYRKIFS